MKLNHKFWWIAAAALLLSIVILATTTILLWYQFTPGQKAIVAGIFKEYFIYICTAVIMILAALGFMLDGIFRYHVRPVNRLCEEAGIINTVNPSHRIDIDGSKEITHLADIINETAVRFENLKHNVQRDMARAKDEVENEKNIFAQIMSELPEGVLVCNVQGRVLLYNRRAKRLLGDEAQTPGNDLRRPRGRFIGLGRSIFDVIDKYVIVHALDEISVKLDSQEGSPTSYFVAAVKQGQLLRVEAAPILDHERHLAGFILICFDITQQLKSEFRLNYLAHTLTRDMRSPLAGIRLAIETILEYPEMGYAQLQKFQNIIHNESIALSRILDRETLDYAAHIQTQWPLATIPVGHWIEAVKNKARDKLGLNIELPRQVDPLWVKVDSYSLILATMFVLNRIKADTGNSEIGFEVSRKEKYANLDFVWRGSPLKIETIRRWESQILAVEDETMPLTLKAVLDHHNAEIWSYPRPADGLACFRILLPAMETYEPQKGRRLTILPRSRPEFYDFDLFSQPGQGLASDDRLLKELTYTVFDTETTGLNPTGGDKIISIGAVRIVNGRLLQKEMFDQLIDPQRPVPRESIKIHGIRPEMLKGQPTIEEVLPLFHQFTEDTILVAHNAAFDMRMLQINEAATGIKFIHPVLDTLLLSAVVHPAQDDHNLEAIAKRLGISIIGRHTAMGDAVATGEIFLKFISLLANSNIHTLKQARTASQKTYYARLKY